MKQLLQNSNMKYFRNSRLHNLNFNAEWGIAKDPFYNNSIIFSTTFVKII